MKLIIPKVHCTLRVYGFDAQSKLQLFSPLNQGSKTARSNCLYFRLFDTVPRKKIFDFEKLR